MNSPRSFFKINNNNGWSANQEGDHDHYQKESISMKHSMFSLWSRCVVVVVVTMMWAKTSLPARERETERILFYGQVKVEIEVLSAVAAFNSLLVCLTNEYKKNQRKGKWRSWSRKRNRKRKKLLKQRGCLAIQQFTIVNETAFRVSHATLNTLSLASPLKLTAIFAQDFAKRSTCLIGQQLVSSKRMKRNRIGKISIRRLEIRWSCAHLLFLLLF